MHKFIGTLIILISISSLSFAQEFPKAEAFVGYSYTRTSYVAGFKQNFNGWTGSVAVNGNRWLGFEGNVTGQYGPDRSSNYTFLFGPKFSFRSESRVTPFAHALFGFAHEREGGVSLDGGSTVGDTGYAFALGGGIDAAVGKGLAVRVIQADYLRQNALLKRDAARLSFGLVFRF